MRRAVHFVGFRGAEYVSAVAAFGIPDFIHQLHDRRMRRDVAAGDLVVFGPKASEAISDWNASDLKGEY